VKTDISTAGTNHYVWPDPETNLMQRFYRAANADFSSDGDALSDARETYLYGTDPQSEDTDRDGLDDGEEVFGNRTHGDTDGYITNPLRPDGVDYVLPDAVSIIVPTNSLEGFSTFNPPVTNAATSTAPVISEWMRTANSGESLTLAASDLSLCSGDGEGMDTRFLVFGESSQGKVLVDANILKQEEGLAAVVPPESLPPDSMYLLWPRNGNGYGLPVAINRTEGWWVGPDRVCTGETFSVYGRNLSLGGAGCKLLIEENGEWLESISANPLKADFVLPASLTNGTYTLWAHNGSGRAYGWSEPLQLTVRNPIVWNDDTNTWINVKAPAYNATGNGVSNDYVAIWSAIRDCPEYGTVYFPSGTYCIDSYIYNIFSRKRLLGDGMYHSIITTSSPDLGSTTYGLIQGWLEEVGISGMGFMPGSNYLGMVVNCRASEDVSFVNCRFSQLGSKSDVAVVDVASGSQNIRFEGCDFDVSGNVYAGNSRGIYFKDCAFRGLNDANGLLVMDGAQNVSVSGCSAQSYDDSDTASGSGWAIGRFIVCGNGGTVRNFYISENTTSNLCPRYASPFYRGTPIDVSDCEWVDPLKTNIYDEATQVLTFSDLNRISVGKVAAGLGDPDVQRTTDGLSVDRWDFPTGEVELRGQKQYLLDPATTNITAIFWDAVDQNSGEQILFEAQKTRYRGVVQSSTSNTVQCIGLTNDYSGLLLVVVDGKGFGQSRVVESVDVQTSSATVDRPWHVEPEASSRVMIGNYASRIAISNNRLDGDGRATDPYELLYGSVGYSNYTASCGVSFYGGTLESVVEGNVVSDVRSGIANWSLAEATATSLGIPLVQPNYFNLFKGNSIIHAMEGVSDHFKSFHGNPTQDIAMACNVWRSNTATNLTGVAVGTGADFETALVEMNLFHGNRFEGGLWGIDGLEHARSLVLFGNAFKGANTGDGITFSTNHVPILRENSWSGFSSNYAGALPGGVIGLPVRMVELSDGLTNAVLDVWNSGTSNLEWTASTTNAWITITQASGMVADEVDEGLMAFWIDPSSIPAGVSNGAVFMIGNGQTNSVGVRYNE